MAIRGQFRCPNLDNSMAIRDTVARLISDVCAGKLHPGIEAGLGPLMHLQLRVLEKAEFEKRLAKVERCCESRSGSMDRTINN